MGTRTSPWCVVLINPLSFIAFSLFTQADAGEEETKEQRKARKKAEKEAAAAAAAAGAGADEGAKKKKKRNKKEDCSVPKVRKVRTMTALIALSPPSLSLVI